MTDSKRYVTASTNDVLKICVGEELQREIVKKL